MSEFPPDSIIDFPDGIPGLDGCRRFVIARPEGCEPILLLQSVDDENISLPAVPVESIKPDYRLKLSNEDRAFLDVTAEGASRQDVICLSVLILPGRDYPPMCNLQAPLVINPAARKGRQVIQADSEYPSCFPLEGD